MSNQKSLFDIPAPAPAHRLQDSIRPALVIVCANCGRTKATTTSPATGARARRRQTDDLARLLSLDGWQAGPDGAYCAGCAGARPVDAGPAPETGPAPMLPMLPETGPTSDAGQVAPVDAGPTSDAGPALSAGHRAIIANYEYYHRAGALYRAPMTAPIMPDGYRAGRWQCADAMADSWIAMIADAGAG